MIAILSSSDNFSYFKFYKLAPKQIPVYLAPLYLTKLIQIFLAGFRYPVWPHTPTQDESDYIEMISQTSKLPIGLHNCI